MPDIQVIQPSELNTQHFVFENGRWRLAMPYVSNDAENQLVTGSDGGAFLLPSKLKRYRLIPDNAASTLSLYEYFGDYFDQSTATLLDVVDLATVSVEVDDFAISNNTVIHFKDVQTGNELTFDTALPIYEIFYANSQSVRVQGTGKHSELVMDIIINPHSNNLFKITTEGVMVDADDVISLMNSHIEQTLKLEHNASTNQLEVSLGNSKQTLNTMRLVNSSGDPIGFIVSI